MKMIEKNYIVHKNTFALLPARQIDYQTIVLENNKQLHVRKTPFEIIRESCLHHWSTYEGSRQAVIHHFGFKQKTPVPIYPEKDLYFFPTRSPKNDDNIWLAYQPIRHVYELTKHPPQTMIYFNNRESITIQVSKHIILSQLNRTAKIYHQRANYSSV